jgi:DNA-binding CsgD family transcriptional regulator
MSVGNERPGHDLLGRDHEREVLDGLLESVRAGDSRVLVLRGAAGVGKSALIDVVAARASGHRVARAAGVESEMELAFAGLHQLCAPMLHHLERLPDPQRDALSIAFGLTAGAGADRFLVGLAVLGLLAEVAADEPLVCLIDDAQWLDRASAQALAFVARRLMAESVALVFAVREPSARRELDGLPDLTIGGLSERDARVLLDSSVRGRLDDQVRDRIIAESHGNPLALLELPRGLSTAQLAGGFGRPDARPLASQIEHSFMRRIRTLSPETRRLLLTAAAEPVGDLALLQRAADRLGIGIAAAAEAQDAGLIDFGPRVRFRHPLVRSAAYRAGTPLDRQVVHGALADATDPAIDPDRRAWHRANAAALPDDLLAADLERSASTARARGGVAAAAAFLARATELTADPTLRGRRAIAAAAAEFEAGAPDATADLLALADRSPLEDGDVAARVRLRAQIVFARNRGREATPLLLEAARRLEPVDVAAARETYLEALGAAIFAGRLGTQPTMSETARIALTAPPPPAAPRPMDLLLDATAIRITSGYAAAVAPLRAALDAFHVPRHDGSDADRRWFWLAWLLAGELWDDAMWDELATHAVHLARATGSLQDLPIALTYRAGVHVHAGEFRAAAALIEESDALTPVVGQAPLKYATGLLMAWQGDEEIFADLFRWAVVNATERGEGRALGHDGYMHALLYNGLGRYGDALVSAHRACEHDDLGSVGFALVELVEAAARTGAHDDADDALARLEERTRAAGTDWSLGVLARSRALRSDGAAADDLYREAIERLQRCRVAVHLARTHLVYGEWLRRENRRLDARAQLRIAHGMLAGMGAAAFAERARRELVATGETVRKRAFEAPHILTAQETQIARLTAAGHTNQEIGSQLFISPRTVEYHLRKVFSKYGINSRRQLRTALASAPT